MNSYANTVKSCEKKTSMFYGESIKLGLESTDDEDEEDEKRPSLIWIEVDNIEHTFEYYSKEPIADVVQGKKILTLLKKFKKTETTGDLIECANILIRHAMAKSK